MKLFRFGERGNERPGVLNDTGDAFDVSGFGEDYGEEFFASDGVSRLRKFFKGSTLPGVWLNEVRIAPVIRRPSKIVCVGLNYRSHASEMEARLPKEPKIFMKATTALAGMSDPVIVPRGSSALDYEVELAIVIGRECRYVEREDARSVIAGYTLMNDYSEREFQKNREGQWVKGKSADSFAPLGPFFVPADEFNPDDVRLYLSVNGELRQDARTKDLLFGVDALVASISQYMTLLPGDVISTGTPGGVGMGFSPPKYLQAGDEVVYGIEGIGEAKQVVLAFGEGKA
jgi:2,4-didehydro-3-deoxy-L-rhamnonate hydrolase